MARPASSFLSMSDALRRHLHDEVLDKWYPRIVDTKCGGYFTNATHDWHLTDDQEKMIVTQARHLWTTAKAAGFESGDEAFADLSLHGLRFLRDHMWDERYGGFYQIRNRQGGYSDCRGWCDEKRTYGNAFALFSLASCYALTHDHAVLELARESFEWLEAHAYDAEWKGYFAYLTRQGEPFDDTSQYRSVASDKREIGFKDFGSSVHLLEAYTELYKVWQNDPLRSKLASLLELIRGTMMARGGYFQMYFGRDWTPVTFRRASEATRTLNYGLDRISFGDDLKASYLMLEASSALRLQNDGDTLAACRRLLDHAIDNGWDKKLGGFFDAGYYLNSDEQCTIIKNTKTWWAQAEALNTLLIFSWIYPEDLRYPKFFIRQWHYIDEYVVDHKYGDWFERGLDTDPTVRLAPKSHMWKCTYHTARALMNCIALITDDEHSTHGIRKRRSELLAMINHWKKVRRASGVSTATVTPPPLDHVDNTP